MVALTARTWYGRLRIELSLLCFHFALLWSSQFLPFSTGLVDSYEMPESYYPDPYDHPYHINISGLSITSIIYNPSTTYSPWVSRLFGETAIFHNRTYGFRSAHPLTPQEKIDRSYLFQKAFRLPSDALIPSCSIEILGYVPVDKFHPFTFDDQMSNPSVGKATLQFPLLRDVNDLNRHLPQNMTWNCYYRATYENTLKEFTFYVKQYWPVFLFCPAPKFDHSCLSLLHLYHQEFIRQLRVYWKVLKTEYDQSRDSNRSNSTTSIQHDASQRNRQQHPNLNINTTSSDSPRVRRILSKSIEKDIMSPIDVEIIEENDIKREELVKGSEHIFESLNATKDADLSFRESRRLASVNYLPKNSGQSHRVRKKRRNPSSASSSQQGSKQASVSSTGKGSSMDYKQYTSIQSSPMTDFRELYMAATPIYPTSALAYLSAILTSPVINFSRLNFPKPVFEYQVSNAILAIISRIQRLVQEAVSESPDTSQNENGANIKKKRKVFYSSQITLPLTLTMFVGDKYVSDDIEEAGDVFVKQNESPLNPQARLRRTEEANNFGKGMENHANQWSVHLNFDMVNSLRKKADRPFASFSESGEASTVQSRSSFHKAVCTVIPYTMKDGERTKMNGWMVYEFVRYYSRLGFLVMMYDREGENLQYINKYFDFENENGFRYSKSYKNSKADEDSEPWNLRYYDFTIMQLLRLYPSNIVYNNKDGVIDRSIVRSDFDKRLTLTQCRFSAKQLFGIEEILVVDFDEFLYCPRASLGKSKVVGGGNIGTPLGPSRRLHEDPTPSLPSTAKQQREFFDSYANHLMNKGIEQFVLKQRVVVSKYGDMRECLMSQFNAMESFMKKLVPSSSKANLMNASSLVTYAEDKAKFPLPIRPSLFHCLSSFHYGIKMFFEKSYHLNNACPYTSFHYASNLRQFDCHATSYISTSKTRRHYHSQGCSVIHITTKATQYNRTHTYDWQKILNEPYNQLYALSYGPLN